RQKPEVCLVVRMAYFMPASRAVRTHWSGSSAVGLYNEAGACPVEHSSPSYVLMPKHRNMPKCRSSHSRTRAGDGRWLPWRDLCEGRWMWKVSSRLLMAMGFGLDMVTYVIFLA